MNDNIQLLENYLDYLDNCSSSRKNNLADLKHSIDKESNIRYKFTIIRSSLPIIYSHYEGFLKDCFSELMQILASCGNNKNINFLIFNIVTTLDENIKSQYKKINKLLPIFDELTKNNNYLYGFNVKNYNLGFEAINETLKLLGLDNPYESYENYKNLNEVCSQYKIDPIRQIKSLYDKRCEIAHGNLEVEKSQIYSLTPKKDITESQVNVAVNDWSLNYFFILSSIDVYKDSFYSYLQEYFENTIVI